MSKNQQKKEPKPATSGKPKDTLVIDFKSGPILAQVWYCYGNDGANYLKFSLPRLYKSKTDRWVYDKSYFGRNEEDMVSALKQASGFCNEHSNNPEQAFESAKTIKQERESQSNESEDVATSLILNTVIANGQSSVQ